MDIDFNQVYETIEQIPETFRPLFSEGEEGGFAISETYKPIAQAVTGLNTALKASRAEVKNRKNVDLSVLADYGKTPEEIKQTIGDRLQEYQDQLAEGGKAKLNLDKVRKELAEAHSKEKEKIETKANQLQDQLYKMMVENSATTAIVEQKGIPELLMPFVKNSVRVVEEGGLMNVYVVDAAGDKRYSGISGQPMTIKELISEMKIDSKMSRLFDSDAPQGGGMNPRGGQPPARSQSKPKSSVEKISAGLSGRIKS